MAKQPTTNRDPRIESKSNCTKNDKTKSVVGTWYISGMRVHSRPVPGSESHSRVEADVESTCMVGSRVRGTRTSLEHASKKMDMDL
jgi:hypothetical protein